MKREFWIFLAFVCAIVMIAYFIQDQGAKFAAQKAREKTILENKRDLPKTPMENPSGQSLTLKQAVARTQARAGRSNLQFFSYRAWQVTSSGQALNYEIVCYDSVAKQLVSLIVDKTGEERLEIKEVPKGEKSLALVQIKDSTDLLKEAFVKYAQCSDNISIEATLEAVSIKCLSPSWKLETKINK